MFGLTELCKYTALSRHMEFSIEKSLHLFMVIKRFHEQGLTSDPRFPNMQLAIVNSLLSIQACLKPEFAIAQSGYDTPVEFSAWSNVVNLFEGIHAQLGGVHDPWGSEAEIFEIFSNGGLNVNG